MTPVASTNSQFILFVGPCYLVVPGLAVGAARAAGPIPGTDPLGVHTHQQVTIGRIQLLIHLDSVLDPDDLKASIASMTRENAVTPSTTVHGIPGVSYGSCQPAKTQIDWWLKKGDTMICIALLSRSGPVTVPTPEDRDAHAGVIASLTYIADDPRFQRPGTGK